MRHLWWKVDIHVEFWWGNTKVGGNFVEQSINKRIILKCITTELDGRAWTEFIMHMLAPSLELL